MSDFDAVLERLLTEPSFAAALAADPDAALSGYRLDAGEAEVLRSQVSADAGGGQAAVETRANKSSTFGLFSAFADLGHTLSADSAVAGSAVRHVAGEVAGQGARHGLGDAPGGAPGGAGWARHGLGDAPGGGGSGGGGSGGGAADQPWHPAEHSGLGSAPATTQGLGDAPGGSGFGDAPGRDAIAGAARAAGHLAPPAGYHPHIDADGDGHWDKATFVGTPGHGVEIFVDVNHDGHADFVGHDTDGDGLVDYADYDKDDNGVFEKRMYDDNGDGWLDRTIRHKDG